MNEVINAANIIYELLSTGEKCVFEIKDATQLPAKIIYIAIGWLLKENKVEVINDGLNLKIKRIG